MEDLEFQFLLPDLISSTSTSAVVAKIAKWKKGESIFEEIAPWLQFCEDNISEKSPKRLGLSQIQSYTCRVFRRPVIPVAHCNGNLGCFSSI
jgi:hypothetical protein